MLQWNADTGEHSFMKVVQFKFGHWVDKIGAWFNTPGATHFQEPNIYINTFLLTFRMVDIVTFLFPPTAKRHASQMNCKYKNFV